MVELPSHRLRLSDRAYQDERLNPEYAERRAEHLDDLGEIEELVRKLAPLPASYDVSRMQPPYFNEFMYTEFLGGLWVAPQSVEAAARIVQAAAASGDREDLTLYQRILARPMVDKYRPLQDAAAPVRRVAILPGDLAFARFTGRETLLQEMAADPALMIKLHPMTSDNMVRDLGREFGYHRILDKDSSGYFYSANAEEVLTVETSELGIYAALKGVRIRNITKTSGAAQTAYHPIYRLLWDQPPAEARARVLAFLNSDRGGFFYPGDPQLADKIKRFFRSAMKVRERLRPLVNEFGPIEWANALHHRCPPPVERK